MKTNPTDSHASARQSPGVRRLPVLLLFLVAVLTPFVATFAATEVVVHASRDSLFVARIDTRNLPGTRPVLETRLMHRDSTVGRFTGMPLVYDRVVSLASLGDEVVAVCPLNVWLTYSDTSVQTQRGIPDGALFSVFTDIADNSSNQLYGVAVYATGPASSPNTRPATTPTTAPATQPIPRRWIVRNVRGKWTPLVQLPAEVTGAWNIGFSASIFDARPIVAVVTGPLSRHVNVIRQTDAGWETLASLDVDFNIANLKLLRDDVRPVLWVAPTNGPGAVFVGGVKWTGPIPVPPEQPELLGTTARDVAMSGGFLRVVWINKADGIVEHQYAVTPASVSYVGTTGQLPEPSVPTAITLAHAVNLTVMASLIAFAVGLFRPRLPASSFPADLRPRIAAARPRLLAAIVDGFPILAIGVMVALFRLGGAPEDRPWFEDNVILVPMAIAAAIYLIHILIGEIWLGRSFGKMLFGLYVVGIDGAPITPLAAVLRNVLRFIDVFPIPLGCLLSLVTPLKQRLGDMVAQTVVITGPPPALDDDDAQEPPQ